MNSTALSKNSLIAYLENLFPNAGCELNHANVFELLIAVILSAQTHDSSVNKVTNILFAKYKTAEDFRQADVNDLELIIRPIGLSRKKSQVLKFVSSELVRLYDGKVPDNLDDLQAINGIGRKTASVILVEGFKIPAFPVDTHVKRIAGRLALCDIKDNVLIVENKLRNYFTENEWIKVHHLLIHFGRYFCKAQKPTCALCELIEFCREGDKNL
ncbi:MAG: endonuclease III [Erysipelotrichales bacterium]|nr:endonuclease III [Erysipelotrichales bacterium]